MINAVGKKLLKKFKKGDLVSWKTLDGAIKTYGFIKEFYLKELPLERTFVMAIIQSSTGNCEEINAHVLKLESRSD